MYNNVVIVLLNNILIQRGMIAHEPMFEERTMRISRDEITIGTEHWRSDEWRERWRVARAKLNLTLCCFVVTRVTSGVTSSSM